MITRDHIRPTCSGNCCLAYCWLFKFTLCGFSSINESCGMWLRYKMDEEIVYLVKILCSSSNKLNHAVNIKQFLFLSGGGIMRHLFYVPKFTYCPNSQQNRSNFCLYYCLLLRTIFMFLTQPQKMSHLVLESTNWQWNYMFRKWRVDLN